MESVEVPRRILIIEDDSTMAYALKKSFVLNEWEASVITDSTHASESIETHDPAVVLLDMKMPKLSGIDVLRIVNAKFPWVRTVVLTGYPDIGNSIEALNLGVFGYLMKPMHWDEVLNRCEQARKDIPDVIWAFNKWFRTQPDPDREVYRSGSGEVITARRLMHEVRTQTELGRAFLSEVLRVAAELVATRLK